ncbi:MAG: hypothetical protein M0D54_13995 [Hyphomonadaceae bacterium JAD_PAG50586_4]|nr:MAG: hypothetical protein M0D54_13995 [Hyphomonadaceae bacterium JAD_PAG50586_4]
MAGVFLIVWLIALIYSGEVQRSLSGPVELRQPSRPMDERVIQAPQAIIPTKLDGLWASCSFQLVYLDARGRSVHKAIYRRHMKLTSLGRRLSAKSEPSPLMIEGAYQGIENLTFDQVARPDPEIVCMAGSICDLIVARAQAELRRPIERLERVKQIPLYRILRRDRLAKRRPATDQEPTIQFKMRFHTNPWFVLSTHPDREVKTTAWLTVLTSVFALAMQLMYGTWPDANTPRRSGDAAETTRIVPTPRVTSP